MSLAAMSWAWDQQLPPLEKLALLGFANGADPWAGKPAAITEVAEFCGVTRDEVRHLFESLLASGHVDEFGYVLHPKVAYACDGEDQRPTPRPREPRTGVVYVFEDVVGQRAKIGFTGNDPAKRKRAIEHASGCELSIAVVIPGTDDDEAALHARFASAHLRGEWFKLTDEVRAWISEAAT
jgi:hypothetical protein